MKNTYKKYYKLSVFLILLFIIFLFSFVYKSNSLAQTTGIVSLSVDSAYSIKPGSSVDLNIQIDPTTSTIQPVSVQWDFIYDTSNITSITWKSNGQATLSAGKSASCNIVSGRIFRCLIVGFNNNLIPKGTLGTITVTINNSTNASSIPIAFSSIYVSGANDQAIPGLGNQGVITIYKSGTNSNTNNQALSATCSPNMTNGFLMNNVTWSAFPYGGTGSYQYLWTGSENLNGTGQSASILYSTEGVKTASVTVTSGTEQITIPCASTVTINRPLISGWCSVQVIPISNNEYSISWGSFVNSNAPLNPVYSWSGTDGLSSNSSSVIKKYNSTGIKNGNVLIQSGQQSFTLNCSVDTSKIFPSSGTTPPLGGGCSVYSSGLNIDWKSNVNGGSGQNPLFQWLTTDGYSTTTPNPSFTYNSDGIKSGTLLIKSGNESLTATCQAKIVQVSTSTGCFIATAAFGTELEPKINVLREFRDEKLMKNEIGSAFVDIYYEVSPPIANFIRQNNALKTVVRTGLEPIIFVLEKSGYGE